MNKPLWIPSKERIENLNLKSFLDFLSAKHSLLFSDYHELYQWSIDNISEFWETIWNYSGIISSEPYDSILQNPVMPGAKWFNGTKLNFAENLLRYRNNHTAIISYRENQQTLRLTYQELYKLTAKCTYSLKAAGVKQGDRIAGIITNTPEAIIAMLASTSIGALWSSASPDFGVQSIVDRFSQIQPKVLFAVESYSYNGKMIDCSDKIKEVTANIPSIEKIILVPFFYDFKNPIKQKINYDLPSSIYIDDFLNNQASEIEFVQLPFDHPVYIMYSSGTTGIPKCIVHGAGGTLLQHFKELSLHTDLKRSDVITYYTTCGWMMWNWLISSLMIGSTIFLIDGSAAYPNLELLWQKIDEEQISIFGTSPKFLSICQKSDILPKQKFKLNSLRTILSTGSPLLEENFNWVYKSVKQDVQLSSISGGTDIISCFGLGCPILPVYAPEIQCRGLGMKVEAFDEEENPVIEKQGELVCTKPFPSMPVFFWNDPKGEKYKSAYFERYPGVWHHGDFIKITKNGGVIVYGRSDATLNPGGVRIGTSEIYRVVEAIPEVVDSLTVGQNWNNDVRIILFIVLKGGAKLDENLKERIKLELKTTASPRHVPAKIIEVKDIPRTINGKKVEIAVNRIIHGLEINNKDVLANPDSLSYFSALEELTF